MTPDFEILVMLFMVAAIAGWVDVIAGGGGLITIPALMLVGVPPAAALATNKLQGSAGTLSSSLYFIRQGVVDLHAIRYLILATFIGSLMGAYLLLRIDASQLMVYLPVLLIAIALYFLLSPSISDVDSAPKLGTIAFALLLCPLLGFYDGFFGPGTGSFMLLAFVSVAGYRVSKATAHTKVLNFTSNIASLLYFVLFGEIYWIIGGVMIAGQLLGSIVGSRMVLENGSKLVRPVVVVVCFTMSANLIYKHLVG